MCECRSECRYAFTIENQVSAVTSLTHAIRLVPNICHILLLKVTWSLLVLLKNRSHKRTNLLPKRTDTFDRDPLDQWRHFNIRNPLTFISPNLHLNSSGLVSAHFPAKPLALHFRALPWVLIIENVSTVAALLIASPSAVGGEERGAAEN